MPTLSNVDDVEKSVESFEKRVPGLEEKKMEKMEEEITARKEEKERRTKESQVYDLVLKHAEKLKGPPASPEATKSSGPKAPEKEISLCPTCGGVLEENGVCKTCSKKVAAREKSFIAQLHPNYTFENFVVGSSNHFAHAAALAVAKNPSIAYNPLFIWSEPGLGKTHLLNAIANRILAEHPDMRVVYVTTEQFTNDLIDALKNGEIDEFRREYRSADVLIVDDVQFLAGKDQTQEEFFHTFNALFTVDKQIVLASDRPPKEIPTLKQRLVSRFEGGLIVQIEAPDYETRRAILEQKASERGIEVDPGVLDFVARHVKTNIRELEGALNKIMAFSSFTGRAVDLDLAREVLKDVISEVEEVGGRESPGGEEGER
ncbi:MAG: chromosomal replication initiator protein DnaA, partial [Thermoplasmata archaeon]|nr:chromosomal replication initiator protein DnaA [Thermoplasmata archaeon]